MSLNSTHPNADVLRRFFTAFGGPDRDAMRELITDDFTYTFPGRSAFAGVYHGVDGLIDGIRRTAMTLGMGRNGFELQHILADDDVVVTIHRDFYTGDDNALDLRYLLVVQMRDGLMAHVDEIPFDQDANDAYLGRQTRNYLQAALAAAAQRP